MSYRVVEKADPSVDGEPGAPFWVVYCGSTFIGAFGSPKEANACVKQEVRRDVSRAKRRADGIRSALRAKREKAVAAAREARYAAAELAEAVRLAQVAREAEAAEREGFDRPA